MTTELTAKQEGWQRRLTAVEAIKQVLAHHNMTEDAILIRPEDYEQVTAITDRVSIFDVLNNKIIANCFDREDPDIASIYIPDVFRFVRDTRAYEFNPTEHGLDYEKPEINIKWPIADIRKSFESMAEIDPPKVAVMRPRKVKVIGCFKK